MISTEMRDFSESNPEIGKRLVVNLGNGGKYTHGVSCTWDNAELIAALRKAFHLKPNDNIVGFEFDKQSFQINLSDLEPIPADEEDLFGDDEDDDRIY